MKTESTIQPPDMLAPGVIPDRVSVHDTRGAADPLKVRRRTVPASSPRRRHRVGVLLAKLLGVIGGDRYMVNASPPAGDAEVARNGGQVYRHEIGSHRDTATGESEVAGAEHTKER